MKLIFQIMGDLSPKNIVYLLENQEIEAISPGEALKKYFKSKSEDVKCLFLLPISLLELSNLSDKTKEKLDENSVKKEINLEEDNEVFIIPSIGEYTKEDQNISKKYEGSYLQISTIIFSKMVETYLKNQEKVDEIYLDISRGHNIFVSASLDALKSLSVFIQLFNSFKNNVSFNLIFSPPFPQQKKIKAKIEKVKFSVRVFFDLPLKSNRNINLLKNLLEKSESPKINELITLSKLLFSSIKNSVLLPLFYLNYPEMEELKNHILELTENFYKKSKDNRFSIEEKDDDLKTFRDYILNLAFIYGVLSKIKERLKTREEDGVDVEDLKKISETVKELVNTDINQIFLEREIENLKEIVEGQEITSWTKLSEIKYKEIKKNSNTSKSAKRKGDKRRNFFAHAGLEESMIEVKKSGNTFMIRYLKNELELLKKNKGEIYNNLMEQFRERDKVSK